MASNKNKSHVSSRSLYNKSYNAMDLSGLVVALTTPMNEKLDIDQTPYIRHLEYLAEHGIKRILVAGTTGEFFSLLPEERKLLLSLARRHFPGLVLFQAGAESLSLTIEQIQWAADLGADAVLIVPPYYYADVTEKGLIRYFQSIHEKTELPLILYNIPRHTQLPFTPKSLFKIPHFGMKDSAANLDLIKMTPHYFVGGDSLIMNAFQQGASGFFTTRANYCPEIYVAMENALKRVDWTAVQAIQDQINEMREITGSPNDIQKVKAATTLRLPEYPANVRVPLMPLSKAEYKAVQNRLSDFLKRYKFS